MFIKKVSVSQKCLDRKIKFLHSNLIFTNSNTQYMYKGVREEGYHKGVGGGGYLENVFQLSVLTLLI